MLHLLGIHQPNVVIYFQQGKYQMAKYGLDGAFRIGQTTKKRMSRTNGRLP